jgi:hypothetical protein
LPETSPWRAVLAAAALSLALNVVGNTWGLPARWHPDEKADGIARMAEGQGLGPDSFVNPSLPLYLQLPFVWMQRQVAERGLLPGASADPLLLCRFLSALAGAGAVLFVGLVAARTAPGTPPWPAFFLALAPGLVNLCHFATPEAWVLLGAAATLLVSMEHALSRAPAWLLGLVLGLTASTKYTGAAFAVPALAAVLLRERSTAGRRDRLVLLGAGLLALALGAALSAAPGQALAAELRLRDARLLHAASASAFVRGLGHAGVATGGALVALAALAAWARTRAWAARLARAEIVVVGLLAAAGFLLGTPFAALEPVAFLSDLAFNAQTRAEYKGLVGASTSFVPYLVFLSDALTWPLLVAAGLGLVAAAAAWRDRASVVLLLGAIAPYVLVASSGHRAMRFVAPALPAAAWLAARGIEGAIRPPRAATAARALLLGRAALGSALVLRLFFVDSRLLAERWIESHVPRGSTIDLIANHPGYAPRMPEGRALRVVPTLSREMAPGDRFLEAAGRYPSEAGPWLILTASFYERFLENPAQRPERARFFSELLEGRGGFEVVARFRQQGFRRPTVEFVDPEIVILKKR